MTSDPFDLQRFVTAQNPVYEAACAELRNGRKEGTGCGSSSLSSGA
jgi:uncharacterized protein (DUF1810 family)